MPQFEGVVLFPQSRNLDRPSKVPSTPNYFAVKWDVDGDTIQTWHPKGEGAGLLRKGAKAQFELVNGKLSLIENSWDPSDLESRGTGSAPTSNNAGSAPARYQAPVGQPLDVVGQAGREEALNAELTQRLKLMNRTMKAVTKSMAISHATLVEQGIALDQPVDFAALAEPMSRMANTLMMGLFSGRDYFGVSEQGENE